MTQAVVQAVQPLTTTLLIPEAASSGLSLSVDITSFPTSLLETAGQGLDALAHDFWIVPLATVPTLNGLGPAVYSLLVPGLHLGTPDQFSYLSGQPSFNALLNAWASGGSFPVALQDFAEYVAFGDTAIVEDSPPRRTSPAAVAASRLMSGVILAGAPTSAVVAHMDGSPVMIVIGASVTIVLATTGAGLTLVTHWLARKMEV
jgi:hypothetical protein